MAELKEKIVYHRAARVIEVIETITLEGSGREHDSYREILWYHKKSGELLACFDSLNPGLMIECFGNVGGPRY